MKSVVLCEGPDDLWFIAYYLHKTAGWNICTPKKHWSNYEVVALTQKQKVVFMEKGDLCVAIWCVAGKDCFKPAISTIYEKFIYNFPFDPISSIVIVEDRDDESTDAVLLRMQGWFPGTVGLENTQAAAWRDRIDGVDISLNIVPVIIPFSEEGAIETLLMNAISEKGCEEEIIVQAAKKYIADLIETEPVGTTYLSHRRLILKAKYAAVIAAINPGHSTGLFKDMVLSSPWEESPSVKTHFDVIVQAISMPQA